MPTEDMDTALARMEAVVVVMTDIMASETTPDTARVRLARVIEFAIDQIDLLDNPPPDEREAEKEVETVEAAHADN